MKIEDLQVEVQPRTDWQAVDLGIIVARRWYLPLFFCFAMPPLVLFVFCLVVLPSSPTWSAFLIWWFKPVYERIPLSYLSTAIFGDTPTVRQAFGRWRACVLPGLLPALTYQRFVLDRSFRAPISVLEGLRGANIRRRRDGLNSARTNEASWLTILCVHVEAFLYIGFLIGLFLAVPEQFRQQLSDVLLNFNEGAGPLIMNLAYVLSIIVMGPFYVAAGFCLYLNKRVELEAWDIEIGFKKIASRVAQTLSLALIVGVATFGAPHFAHAQQAPQRDPLAGEVAASPPSTNPQPLEEADALTGRDESAAVIKDVLATADYHEIESIRYPKLFGNSGKREGQEADTSNISLPDLSWIASVAEVLLWALAIGALVWVGYRLSLVVQARMPQGDGPAAPKSIFGITLREDALPDDILGAASQRWRDGHQRVAISLLLRGWLIKMIDRQGCRFREGDTEADCLHEVSRRSDSALYERFARLIVAWQYAAYAHRTAGDDLFEGLRQDWLAQWSLSIDL